MKLDINIDEYLPLREVVFRALRNAIVQGEFQPGERLMEVTIANKLGVSRTPVREAIRMLELEGLVVMIPRKGAEVANITVKDLKDALEVRMAIEALSVRLACERIDETGKEELKQVCIAFREAINSKLVPAIVEADEAFHNTIYKLSQNPRLINIAQNLREQVYRYRVEYVKDFSYHDNLVTEHDQITNAILLGDKDTAERIMNEHIYNQEQIVIKNVTNKNN
ncbi:MAG: GntR family transcriptional regulator [Clostridium sp.]|nr:GntR family transcriptional regulator [Clostridium sp.]MCM1173318.1 GntR family transcriptional regulator [Clostridium sp.]MCM1208908.1 GntR family transcriptional regulator [Ruminococcus sp.]MCM1288728.1 GntR family transcriptional regulator [Clostridium sp.]